ncbi:unnamed protein product, partial [Meganyctiphanes norvegica]
MKIPLPLLSLIAITWMCLPRVTSGAQFAKYEIRYGRSFSETGHTLMQRLIEIVSELKPLEPTSLSFPQMVKGYNMSYSKERKRKSNGKHEHPDFKWISKHKDKSISNSNSNSKEHSDNSDNFDSSDSKGNSNSKEGSTSIESSGSKEISDNKESSES